MNRGYAAVALYHPINIWNVGGVLRAAHCFGAKLVFIQENKKVRVRGASTDTPRTWKQTPVIKTFDITQCIPYSCIPIAVEITDKAKSLVHFTHPNRALYILGPENGSLPDKIIEKCAFTIQIPTTHCMNLAATANVVPYDRLAKGTK